jgi:SAM-dependent methyltransferase
MEFHMYFNEDLSGAGGFDLVSSAYDFSRPAYPDCLFQNISPDLTLEIGSGSGQATASLLQISKRVDCIEPGINFCRLLRKKFAASGSITIFNKRFEEFTPDVKYDLVFSASALHWVEKRVAYTKIHECLKSDGRLIAVWNQPRFSDPIYAVIGESIGKVVSDFYIPRGAQEEVSLFEKGFREFEAQGLFSNCEMKIVCSERAVKKDALVSLIWSYVNLQGIGDAQSVLSELKERISQIQDSDCLIADYYLMSTGTAL